MGTVAVSGKFELLARFGYLSRAVVYLMIGLLAAMAGFGAGGDTTGSRGALAQLAAQPLGHVLLFLVGLGLIGYAAWRAVQALGNPLAGSARERAKNLVKRIGWAVSSLLHLGLAFWSLGVVFGTTGGSSDGDWTAKLMSMSWGPWVIGAFGVGTLIAGLNMLYRGWKAKFEEYMHVPHHRRRYLYPVCRLGLAARGVVFLIIGVFLIQAARSYSAQDIGIGLALEAVQQQPQGQWLLALVGLGLVAFAVYSAIESKYRRFN